MALVVKVTPPPNDISMTQGDVSADGVRTGLANTALAGVAAAEDVASLLTGTLDGTDVPDGDLAGYIEALTDAVRNTFSPREEAADNEPHFEEVDGGVVLRVPVDTTDSTVSGASESGGTIYYCIVITEEGECVIMSIGYPDDWQPVPPGATFSAYECDLILPEGEDPCAGFAHHTPRFYLSIYPELREHECVYSVPVNLLETEVDKVEGLFIQFSRSRTKLLGVELLHQWQPAAGVILPANKRHLRFVYVNGVTAGGSVDLSVRFVGDPPAIAGFTWLLSSAPEDPLEPFSTPRVWPTDKAEQLASDYDLSFDQIMEERRAWATDGDNPEQLAHRLFLKIDEMSSGLEDIDEATASDEEIDRARAMWRLSSLLSNRYLIRGANFARAAADRVPIPLEGVELEEESSATIPGRGELNFIATQMYEWLTQLDDGERRSIADIEEAFGLFACGHATAFSTHGAPNGTNMFCFAELAFLIAEHEDALGLEFEEEGDANVFWPRMCSIFAAAAEMFVHCYYRGPDRAICSYRVHHNPISSVNDRGLSELPVLPARHFTDEEKSSHFSTWSALSRTRPIKLPFASGFPKGTLFEGRVFDGPSPSWKLKIRFGMLVYSAIKDTLESLYEDLATSKTSPSMIDPNPPVVDYDA